MDPVERVIADPNALQWIDGSAETGLPPGVRFKVLSENPAKQLRNVLVSFPPGYVEPRHMHRSDHSTFLLQGRWIVEGKEIGPGGYMYGPAGVAHGPFQSPEGSLVFASVRGLDATHIYPPPADAEEDARGQATIICDPSEVPWEDAAELLHLPQGVEFKTYVWDPATERRDGLVRFPPGYVEPRHTHGADHSDTLLEGRWIIEGTEVGLGGHIYGPGDVEHGPFECPDGIIACFSVFGNTVHHWDES